MADLSTLKKILDTIDLVAKLEKSIETRIKAIGDAKQRKALKKAWKNHNSNALRKQWFDS